MSRLLWLCRPSTAGCPSSEYCLLDPVAELDAHLFLVCRHATVTVDELLKELLDRENVCSPPAFNPIFSRSILANNKQQSQNPVLCYSCEWQAEQQKRAAEIKTEAQAAQLELEVSCVGLCLA
jgi:hypothetical protein